MSDREAVFRKDALERLSSPDQLDQLMRVTEPQGWMTLIAIAMLLGGALTWGVFGSIATDVSGSGVLIRGDGLFEVVSETDGRIDHVDVEVGDRVVQGSLLATVDTADLESRLASEGTVVASMEGRVVEVLVGPGDPIRAETPIATLESSDDASLRAVLFVPVARARLLRPGMDARIALSTVSRQEHGYLLGAVESVAPYPATARGTRRLFADPGQATRVLGEGGQRIEVRVALREDSSGTGDFAWSLPTAGAPALSSQILIRGEITVREQRPIALILPWIRARLDA